MSISAIGSSGGPFADLNLSATQQTQIQSILQNGKAQGESLSQLQSQIQGVLTPTQQQTLQTDLANRKQHLGHHHHGGGESSATTEASSSNNATVNGQSVADIQKQATAGVSIAQSVAQNTLLQFGTLSGTLSA